MSIAGWGKAGLIMAGIIGAYGIMGVSMTGGNQAAQATQSGLAILPSDYGPMSASLRLCELRLIKRQYDSPNPGAYGMSSTRAGYDAIAAALPTATLRQAHLPAQLPLCLSGRT